MTDGSTATEYIAKTDRDNFKTLGYSAFELSKFEKDGHRLILKDLPKTSPDKVMGLAVLKMEFEEPFDYHYGSYYPQVSEGEDFSEGLGN